MSAKVSVTADLELKISYKQLKEIIPDADHCKKEDICSQLLDNWQNVLVSYNRRTNVITNVKLNYEAPPPPLGSTA